MRSKSHAAMGRCLLRRYMPGLPQKYRRSFLIGCTQPDRNPATYLKGSLRSRWMRGHNYANAHRYMLRLACRLEAKSRFTCWDYYSLGKLIHYTMDAFTLAHNDHFPSALRSHREYEIRLQNYFLPRLHRAAPPENVPRQSAAELIRQSHARYVRTTGSPRTDTEFACNVCFLLAEKFSKKRPADSSMHSNIR